MPWLIKDEENVANSLFFVHVPRCGGTSLMHHFELPRKVRQNRSLWGKLGMAVFFSRYQTLESRNFPVVTWGNAFAILLLIPGSIMIARYDKNRQWIWPLLGALLCAFAVLLFLLLTVVFTAPVIGRCPPIHRAYLLFVHYGLCRFMESIPWCTGTNITGYIMHLTAHKLLSYQYVSQYEMETAHSMAIVRNPYARMVSIYSFNRFFGEWESFEHFLNDWYRNVTRAYRERGELEEWYTPCHAIPQFEYTHHKGTQLVHSIIKQEDLKYLPKKKAKPESSDTSPSACVEDETVAAATSISEQPITSTVSNLPDIVLDALVNMPHTNQRCLKKVWYDYYNQRTLDMVYEMYRRDFEVFDYDAILHQRPDLQAPATFKTTSTGSTKTNLASCEMPLSVKEVHDNVDDDIECGMGEGAGAKPIGQVATAETQGQQRRPLHNGFASTESTTTANSTNSSSGGDGTNSLPLAEHDGCNGGNGSVQMVSFVIAETTTSGSGHGESGQSLVSDDELERDNGILEQQRRSSSTRLPFGDNDHVNDAALPPSGASSLSD